MSVVVRVPSKSSISRTGGCLDAGYVDMMCECVRRAQRKMDGVTVRFVVRLSSIGRSKQEQSLNMYTVRILDDDTRHEHLLRHSHLSNITRIKHELCAIT